MKNTFGHSYILPFQGANWVVCQLSHGVANGLGYVAPSVRIQHQYNRNALIILTIKAESLKYPSPMATPWVTK